MWINGTKVELNLNIYQITGEAVLKQQGKHFLRHYRMLNFRGPKYALFKGLKGLLSFCVLVVQTN